MRFRLTFGLLIFLVFACSGHRQNSDSQTITKIKTSDSLKVGSKIITDEIAGSAFRTKAIGYFVICDKDTSDFTCVFYESKDGGKVGIDLNIPYLKASMAYRKRMDELETILPKAAKDFDFDSLTSIRFGRLILSGDLAIDVTKQYEQKFGTSNKVVDYKTVELFLKESKLGTDIDRIFKPYSISVDNVSLEKVFFTTKEDLFWASKIEIDSVDIPDKILDCMLTLNLKRNEQQPITASYPASRVSVLR
jgi:hypothetical protein